MITLHWIRKSGERFTTKQMYLGVAREQLSQLADLYENPQDWPQYDIQATDFPVAGYFTWECSDRGTMSEGWNILTGGT